MKASGKITCAAWKRSRREGRGGGLTVANALATRYLAQTFYLFYLLIYFTFLPLLLVTQQNNRDNHFSQYRAALVGTFTVATH